MIVGNLANYQFPITSFGRWSIIKMVIAGYFYGILHSIKWGYQYL